MMIAEAIPGQAVHPLDLDEAGQPVDRGGLQVVVERDRHARPPSDPRHEHPGRRRVPLAAPAPPSGLRRDATGLKTSIPSCRGLALPGQLTRSPRASGPALISTMVTTNGPP